MVGIRARVMVGDVMTKTLITLPETSNARQIAVAMSGNMIGSVIITRNDRPGWNRY